MKHTKPKTTVLSLLGGVALIALWVACSKTILDKDTEAKKVSTPETANVLPTRTTNVPLPDYENWPYKESRPVVEGQEGVAIAEFLLSLQCNDKGGTVVTEKTVDGTLYLYGVCRDDFDKYSYKDGLTPFHSEPK